MDKYIGQLLEDIKQARQKVQPPHPLWLESEADPYDEVELEDLSYVEQFVYGKEIPVSEITGIDQKLLPPPQRLSMTQRALLAEELEALLHHFHLHPEFPINYPMHLKYPFLLKVWSESHVPLSYGENHIELCDFNVDNCPFEGYCTTCSDIELDKNLAKQQSMFDFPTTPLDLFAPLNTDNEEESEKTTDLENVRKLFDHISDSQKLNFLHQLIENHPSVANLFIEAFKGDYEPVGHTTSSPFEFQDWICFVEDNSEMIIEELDMLDFAEIDFDDYNDHDTSVNGYERAEEYAEGELFEVLSPALADLSEALEKYELTAVFAEIISLYKAGIEANPNDPNDSLPLLEAYISIETKRIVDEALKCTPKKTYPLDDFKSSCRLIFTFYEQLGSDKYLIFTCNLLQNYIDTKEFAYHFVEIGKQLNIPLHLATKTMSKVYTLLGDKKAWIQNLELGFAKELDTSLELMDYYESHDRTKFEDAAQKLYKSFGYEVVDYLLPKVQQGGKLYIELLKKKLYIKPDTVLLEQLLRYTTKEEVESYVELFKNLNIKVVAYALLGRHQEIIEMIKKFGIRYSPFPEELNFIDAIALVYKLFPDEAIALTLDRVDALFKAERNRSIYALIARTISTIPKSISGYDRLLQKTLELYNHKPNLPALKDEFKKAGLI